MQVQNWSQRGEQSVKILSFLVPQQQASVFGELGVRTQNKLS